MNTLLLDSMTAERVENSLPGNNDLFDLAVFFGALSDTTRLKILSALSVTSMCVTDISTLTGINQTTVSHNLRLLRTAHIVESRRQGKVIFYDVAGFIPKLMNDAVRGIMN